MWQNGVLIGYWGEDGLHVDVGEISGDLIRTGSIASSGDGMQLNLDEGSMTMLNSSGTERMSMADSVMYGYHKSGNSWVNDGVLDLSAQGTGGHYNTSLTSKTHNLYLTAESGNTQITSSVTSSLQGATSAEVTSAGTVYINGETKTRLLSSGQVEISGASINASAAGSCNITGKNTIVESSNGGLTLRATGGTNSANISSTDDVNITCPDMVYLAGGSKVRLNTTGAIELESQDDVKINPFDDLIVTAGGDIT